MGELIIPVVHHRLHVGGHAPLVVAQPLLARRLDGRLGREVREHVLGAVAVTAAGAELRLRTTVFGASA